MQDGISAAAAAALIPDGASVMFGGFMGVGSPDRIIDALVARGARGLTLIGNDTALPGVGVGKLIDAGCVARVKASHIGTNPMTQKKMISGEIEVELIPQGTLAERIRAGGSGLGGVLTPTASAPSFREGKQVIEIDGASFLLETAASRRFRPAARARGRLISQSYLPADGDELQSAHGLRRRLRHRRARRDRARSA